MWGLVAAPPPPLGGADDSRPRLDMLPPKALLVCVFGCLECGIAGCSTCSWPQQKKSLNLAAEKPAASGGTTRTRRRHPASSCWHNRCGGQLLDTACRAATVQSPLEGGLAYGKTPPERRLFSGPLKRDHTPRESVAQSAGPSGAANKQVGGVFRMGCLSTAAGPRQKGLLSIGSPCSCSATACGRTLGRPCLRHRLRALPSRNSGATLHLQQETTHPRLNAIAKRSGYAMGCQTRRECTSCMATGAVAAPPPAGLLCAPCSCLILIHGIPADAGRQRISSWASGQRRWQMQRRRLR